MSKLFNEGEKVIQIDKEQYDLWRSHDPSGKTVCRAPFVSLDVRGSGVVHPCSHAEMDLGHLGNQPLESIWNGPGFGQVRHRFRDYRVNVEECGGCVHYWKDGMPGNSPAIVEFDEMKVSRWGLPFVPQVLRLDLRTPLSVLDTKTVFRWLPRLVRLDVGISWPMSTDSFFQKLIERATKLPDDNRPKITLRIDDTIPDAMDIPDGIAVIKLSLEMNDDELSSSQNEVLEGLARSLQARGTELILEVPVHQGNWFQLRSWLMRARGLGITLAPVLVSSSETVSLAQLDGDALGCLHSIIEPWLTEHSETIQLGGASSSVRAMLDQLRRWQHDSAGCLPQRSLLSFPDREHSLVQDESALEPFLAGLLRMYSDPSIERWLMGLTERQQFVAEGRHRRSFRLAALWLTCVFDRAEGLTSLQKILLNSKTATRITDEDRSILAGTVWESWFENWTVLLNLKALKPRTRRFRIGSPKPHSSEEPATITVLLATYNQEAFIGEAIRSVLAQTRTDLRLLVVDDASQDGTVEEARKIKDSRLRIIQNPENLREGESLARALEQVDTEYVALLEGDDLFHPKRLERCLSLLEEAPQTAVIATAVDVIDHKSRVCSTTNSSPIFDGKKIFHWLRFYEDQLRLNKSPEDFLGVLLKGNSLITCSNFIGRTNFLRQHREQWKRLQYCIDWHLYLTAALDNALCFLPEALMGYRLHQTNQSLDFAENANWRYYLETNQVVASMLSHLLQMSDGEDSKAFTTVLSAMTDHLNSNTSSDWPGVVLGFTLERLGISPHDISSHLVADRVQELIQTRDRRIQARSWLPESAEHIRERYRMQGETPFLRSIRNKYEGLQHSHQRLQGEVTGLLCDRANMKQLWLKAEQARDQALVEQARTQENFEEPRDQALAEQARAQEFLEEVRARALAEQPRAQAFLEEAREQALAEQTRNQSLAEQARNQAMAKQEELCHQLEELQAERDQSISDKEETIREIGVLKHTIGILNTQVEERTGERNTFRDSLEHRIGEFWVKRLHCRLVFQGLESMMVTIQRAVTLLGLTFARWSSECRGEVSRVMATVCADFPIYSQTFVHQELSQLAHRGFQIRLLYSYLKPRGNLHQQFNILWKSKRRFLLHHKSHEQEFDRYRTRFPEKVEHLILRLCDSSGVTREQLIRHPNFLQAFSFTRMAEVYRPHYLHSYFFYDRSLMALVAGYLLDIPRGISCYADHVLDDYDLKLVPLHLELCDTVIATSERIKAELLEIAPKADPTRILVKPNAIDTTWFPNIERTEPNGGDPFRLVCVNRIEPKKGLLYLVEAIHHLRQQGLNVELHVIGTADKGIQSSQRYKQQLDDCISHYHLWGVVHLEGQHNQEGVCRFLTMSQLFIAPFIETDYGDKDGIPTALLEAMATGLPAVVTDAGSMEEVIQHGREGEIVPQRDGHALASTIARLLADPQRRTQLGLAAAETVRQRFDVRMCEHHFHNRVLSLIESRKVDGMSRHFSGSNLLLRWMSRFS